MATRRGPTKGCPSAHSPLWPRGSLPLSSTSSTRGQARLLDVCTIALTLNLPADKQSNWYMLGKCLWKINYTDSSSANGSLEMLLDVLKKAIQCVPNKRDRHSDKDPILEPHYKIVSVVYKLVAKTRCRHVFLIRHFLVMLTSALGRPRLEDTSRNLLW